MSEKVPYIALDGAQDGKRMRQLEDKGSEKQMDEATEKKKFCDDSDAGSLISQIGRDLSIDCLVHCARADYSTLAQVNRSFRSLVRNKELYDLRNKLGIIEHWVYYSCDLVDWEVFDPVRRRWMGLPKMPKNDFFMFCDKESLAVGTDLLVFGKDVQSNIVYKYSLVTYSWMVGTTTNTPRFLFASGSFGKIAIAAGGCDLTGKILGSAELYDCETGTWQALPSLNTPRKMCSGVVMDGKFYAIGGIGEDKGSIGNPNMLTSGEIFDPNTNNWTVIPDMFPGGPDHALGAAKSPPLLAVVKNELYGAYHEEMLLRKYDKNKNFWTTLGRLPEHADSANGWGLAFRGCGNLLIVIGGPQVMGEGFIEINAWEPNEDPPEWTLLGRKKSHSFVFNCAVMGC